MYIIYYNMYVNLIILIIWIYSSLEAASCFIISIFITFFFLTKKGHKKLWIDCYYMIKRFYVCFISPFIKYILNYTHILVSFLIIRISSFDLNHSLIWDEFLSFSSIFFFYIKMLISMKILSKILWIIIRFFIYKFRYYFFFF